MIPVHVHFDFIQPEALLSRARLAKGPTPTVGAERLRAMLETERVAEVFRSRPDPGAPVALVDRMRAFIAEGGLASLD